MTHPVESSPLRLFGDTPCWLLCNRQKVPSDLRGRPVRNWPAQGYTLAQVAQWVDAQHALGVGINLLRAPILAIDFDAMLDGDRIAHPVAERIIRAAQTFVETSWSGRGLHAFATLLGEHEPINKTWLLGGESNGKQRQISIWYRVPRYIITTGREWGSWGRPLAVIDAAIVDEWLAALDEAAVRRGGAAVRAAKPVPTGRLTRRQAEGVIAFVARQREGNRNEALYWAACRLCEHGATVDVASAALLPAAMHAGLSEREARRTIASAFGRAA